MRRPGSRWLGVVAVGWMAGALLSCAQVGTPPPAPVTAASPAGAPAPEEGADLVGQEVVAFVQGMEMFAHTEEFSDGSVVVSHSTDFAVTEPRRLRYVVTVYTTGLPRIGDRRVQLGDVVQFVLPRNWRLRELTMADLENLRFRD